MKHALVVGGTGMLSGVSLWLLDQGYHVSIIARNAERMKQLKEKTSSSSHITPLLIDYRNTEKLQKKVNETINQNRNIDLVVAWIHSIAKDSLQIIATEVSKSKNEWELYHVLGSNSDLDAIKRKDPVPAGSIYHQVQLGYVNEGSHSRWLTNREISEGVIEAIQKKKKVATIGQIELWEKRP